jgi:hypothetical protein
MEEVRKGMCTKIIMYILFGVVTINYYVFSAICLITDSLKELTDRQSIELENIQRLACFAVMFAVTSIFHPCFFTASFKLSQFNNVMLKT